MNGVLGLVRLLARMRVCVRIRGLPQLGSKPGSVSDLARSLFEERLLRFSLYQTFYLHDRGCSSIATTSRPVNEVLRISLFLTDFCMSQYMIQG